MKLILTPEAIEGLKKGEPLPNGFTEAYEQYRKSLNKSREIDPAPFGEPTKEELAILKNPNLFPNIIKEINKKVVKEDGVIKTILICASGRLVQNHGIASYNLMVNSESGAGKDYVVKNTLAILPMGDYVKRTRISPTALTYWHNTAEEPDWTWDGRVLYLEDISNGVLNSEVMKVMCSEGSNATITINNKAVDVEVKGKPVLIVTTASANPKAEGIRRWPSAQLDESVQQTEAIKEQQAKAAAEGIVLEYDNSIREALRHLRRVKVKVPYAPQFVKAFPSEHIVIRTHFNRFIDYIKASASLHQYQRKKDKEGFVIAEGQDYDLAREALEKTTSNPLMVPLTKEDKAIIDIIRKQDLKAGLGVKSAYSISDLEPLITFLSQKSIYTYLDKLASYGLLHKDKEPREESKKSVVVYSLTDIQEISIPTYDKLCRNITNVTSASNVTSVTSVTNDKKKGKSVTNDKNDLQMLPVGGA